MYKLYSTGLYRFTFVLNAWPVDSLHRSPRRHITVPPLLASIFLALVSAQFRLADQTTGEKCPSGFSLQRYDQPLKRHIIMGTIFSRLCHPSTSLFVRTLCPKTDHLSGDHVRLSNQVVSMYFASSISSDVVCFHVSTIRLCDPRIFFSSGSEWEILYDIHVVFTKRGHIQ